ncbi:hypothetical protein FGRMN_10131 [Fusarium graminum]|nr:hypothetical protein FGRMN_10131 [Fusarium graminum]
MTSRNLNKTWRDVIFEQYEKDYAANVPFPVRYLIWANNWKRDIFIEIPNKIDTHVFRQAVIHSVRTRIREDDPAYEDDLIKIRARVPPTLPQRSDDHPPQDDTGATGSDG